MKVAFLLMMLMALANPATAGEGIIEETDAVIVVELSGDPGDGRPAPATAVEPVAPAAAEPAEPAEPAGPVEGDPPAGGQQ